MPAVVVPALVGLAVVGCIAAAMVRRRARSTGGGGGGGGGGGVRFSQRGSGGGGTTTSVVGQAQPQAAGAGMDAKSKTFDEAL